MIRLTGADDVYLPDIRGSIVARALVLDVEATILCVGGIVRGVCIYVYRESLDVRLLTEIPILIEVDFNKSGLVTSASVGMNR